MRPPVARGSVGYHIRQRVISRRFDDPFKLELMLKDIGIALAVARDAGAHMPLAEAGHPLWQAADHAKGPASASASSCAGSSNAPESDRARHAAPAAD